MSHRHPVPAAGGRSPATGRRYHRSPAAHRLRRRRALLVAVLAPVMLWVALGVGRGPAGGVPRTREPTARRSGPGGSRSPATRVRWPAQGQAALVIGHGAPTASPHETPVAIASVAKVMTAYLTLERDPLGAGEDGFTITISAAEAQAEAQDAAEGQSVVAVATGEQLTERQLLEGLLVPSGNNFAQILAVRVAGSEARFLAEMNARARELGMLHTTYTDPSGLDAGTISTAADQLRVFRQAIRLGVFRQIVSMPSVTLPVAGTLTNFDPLIGAGYDGKTGSDGAAEGCLAFFTRVTDGGRARTAVGVVLGQGRGGATSVVLAAAGRAAQQLVSSALAAGRRARPRRPPPLGAARRRRARPPGPGRDL